MNTASRLALAALLLSATVAAAEAKFTFVDLQPKANQKLADDLHASEGNNLASVPRGEQKLGDFRFKIGEKMVHVRGTGGAADAPEKVEGIQLDAAFDRLHILPATGYGEPEIPDGTEIGAYVVHYGDQTTERIPIVYGEDLRDWYDWPDRPNVKRAKVVWTGKNAGADRFMRMIRLFAVTWENPHPKKKATRIDMESKSTMCDPFLVALTLETKS